MRALVRFQLPDQSLVELGSGDLIGRIWSAALVLHDPRISEAHAMVSLRGGELWLLALRRRILCDGQARGELRLEPGQRLELAEGYSLGVQAVELPEEVLALEAPGLGRVALGSVVSIKMHPTLQIISGFDPSAPAKLWTTGDDWKLDLNGQVSTVQAGAAFAVGAHPIRLVMLKLSGAGQKATRVTGGFDPPLRIVTDFDTVRIYRGEETPVLFSGVSARMLSELVAMGGSAPWEVVAGEIWKDEPDVLALRRRWDVSLKRLKMKLKEAQLRSDLLRADGLGRVELVLRPVDRVEELN